MQREKRGQKRLDLGVQIAKICFISNYINNIKYKLANNSIKGQIVRLGLKKTQQNPILFYLLETYFISVSMY